MKRTLLIAFAILIALGGCGQKSEPPAVTLMAGEEALVYSMRPVAWEGKSYDDLKEFAHIYEDHRDFKAPFVARGTDIVMTFGDTAPGEIRLTDDIVTTEGKFMFLTRETDYPSFDYTDGVLTIPVGRHGTSGRTCGFMEEGRDYRAFRVYATFGEDVCAYTFIVVSES